MRASLELHIEELILHDFPPDKRWVIAAAIEQELTRLFTEQGVPAMLAQGGAIPRLDGVSFEVGTGEMPAAIGRQVAQAIYRGLNHH
jgi:hypothetical protein